MGILTFALELYFALSLGISALTKVNDLEYFATTLRQQRIVPSWSVQIWSRIFPWIEIGIALALISGIAIEVTACSVLLLFVVFLAVKLYLFVNKFDRDCGCYGSAHPQRIDGPDIGVSAILTFLAGIHLWLILVGTPVGLIWRLAGSILFIGVECYLLGNIVIRHHKSSRRSNVDSGDVLIGKLAPLFSAVDQQENTIKLIDFQGQRRLLAFVKPGCPFCPGTLQALKEVLQEQPDLIGLVVGGPDHERNLVYAVEQEVKIPLLTPERDMIEKIYQIHHFPIVFAIDESGVIRAKRVVNKREHLQELMAVAYTPNFVPG